ncbi:hypothetical protein JaAD80_17685 [Janthinobacterium sp. AD80]|nr:hypothetical protein JaAD80_17685 [Janthinobacterium sp. AD80]
MLLQKAGQVARDGRVLRVGQAEFDDAGAALFRRLADCYLREEAVDHHGRHLLARDVGGTAAFDQARAGAQQGDGRLVGCVAGEQQFLGGAAAFHQLRQARGGQLHAAFDTGGQARFHQVRQRQVHIVAAEYQMIADAAAFKLRFAVVIESHVDQAEIGGAAAHVAHQDAARSGQVRAQGGAPALQVVIKSRLRFFDQPQAGQAGHARRLQGECARTLVERGGNGQHQFLRFQGRVGKALVPRGAHVGQIAGAGHHGRYLGHIGIRAPRQDGRLAVHAGMRQPALRAGHEPSRHLRAELACQGAQHGLCHAGHIILPPRQLQVARRQFAGGAVVAQGRQ